MMQKSQNKTDQAIQDFEKKVLPTPLEANW
jgi:hypothetical protein